MWSCCKTGRTVICPPWPSIMCFHLLCLTYSTLTSINPDKVGEWGINQLWLLVLQRFLLAFFFLLVSLFLLKTVFRVFLKSMWQSRKKQHDIYFNIIFIQHSYSLHRTMSLYCIWKEMIRDKRVEETLKCSVVAQRKLTYYWLSDRFGINIFAKRLSCGFQIHVFTFAIYVWKSRLLYSVSSTHLI